MTVDAQFIFGAPSLKRMQERVVSIFQLFFCGNTKMKRVFIQNSSAMSPGSYSAGVFFISQILFNEL